ncbi:patatin-like phospholipase family protein [soil metagenome]
MPADSQHPVAFVLGGGGLLGASEVGMLRALLEAGVTPDLICGTSVGAINGAVVAATPGLDAVERLTGLWEQLARSDVFGGSLLRRTATLVRTRTHLHPPEPLRDLVTEHLGDARIEDLAVPFQCVAASIERATEHWFTDGPLVEAVLASSAVPGLLAPVRIGDEHFLDGGLVASIPVDRAVALGARTIYVLHVGRIDARLRPPRFPWEVGMVAFEIARRHRFASAMATLPTGVDVQVLSTGGEPVGFSDVRQLRYRNFAAVPRRIADAYAATVDHLQDRELP